MPPKWVELISSGWSTVWLWQKEILCSIFYIFKILEFNKLCSALHLYSYLCMYVGGSGNLITDPPLTLTISKLPTEYGVFGTDLGSVHLAYSSWVLMNFNFLAYQSILHWNWFIPSCLNIPRALKANSQKYFVFLLSCFLGSNVSISSSLSSTAISPMNLAFIEFQRLQESAPVLKP